jgi:lipopolysaccharide export system protein LptA
MIRFLYAGFIVCFLPLFCIAQTNDETRVLEILRADRYNFEKRDTSTFISLAGNVVLKQGKTIFTCDSAVLNQLQNIAEAYGKVHINDADSIHTYASYMKYLAKEKKAFLKNGVKLTDGKAVLTTNDLEYETTSQIGIYRNGGKIVNGKTTLTSTEGWYYGQVRDVYFKRKVKLVSPDNLITTDTLLYNIDNDVARFTVPTTIKSGKRTITTSNGIYNGKTKNISFASRSTINDSSYTLTANEMLFDDSTGRGHARGEVIYKTKDTAKNYTLYCNDLKTNRTIEALLATQQPLLVIKQNRDSLFIAADTLYSAKLSDEKKWRPIPEIRDTVALNRAQKTTYDTNSNRFFEAYYHVKIYTDSLQAIADSAFISLEDSAFRLFKNPVVWSQENQITGDTIYLFTQQQKPSYLKVFENALAINKTNDGYFNQLKGSIMLGNFDTSGYLNHLRAKGNAESIYYPVDDDNSYIGVNKSSCDIIDFYFENRAIQKVVLRSELTGTIYPIKQANHEELKLRGFKWLEDLRPKNKFLLQNK